MNGPLRVAASFSEAVDLARDFVACWTDDGPLVDAEEFALQLYAELARIFEDES